MKMWDWIKERWEIGVSDALGQNLLLYVSTLVISILLALITSALSQKTLPVKFDSAKFSRTLADCILPTTITMGVGTFIQNYDVVSKNRIRRSGLNIVLVILTLVYPFAYVLLSLYGFLWLDNFVFVGSIVIVLMGLFSISQITRCAEEGRTEHPADQRALRLEQAGRGLAPVPGEAPAACHGGGNPSAAGEEPCAKNGMK